MKTLYQKIVPIGFVAVMGLALNTDVLAATVSGGALTLNLDRDKLIAGVILDQTPAPSIYVEEFYDFSAAVTRTFNQIKEDNTPTDLADYEANEISATDLQFATNGFVVPPNLTDRQNRPTTFSFDQNDIFGTATGSIGFGGVIRFRVDVRGVSRNRVMLGDMTLEYNPSLEESTPGRSGWVLINHIGFDAGAFNLFDVTTQQIGNTLILNGELGLGDGFDHLGGVRDTRVGSFNFQTTVVPIPAAAWLFLSGFGALFFNSRSKGKKVV